MKMHSSIAKIRFLRILSLYFIRNFKKIQNAYIITSVTVSIIFSYSIYHWQTLKQTQVVKKSNIFSCFSKNDTKKCNRWKWKSLSLENLNIQNKTFTRCLCEGSLFKEIKIKTSDFRQNKFRLAFFENILFFKTNLQKSTFEGAIIKNTIFEDIKLSGVVFQFTTFINVQFKNVDMTQALFIGSRFKNSTYDKNTKLPFSKEIARDLGLKEVSIDKI